MPISPDTRASKEERAALQALAPLRTTLERVVARQLSTRTAPERAAAVEAHWTLILEAYRRGIRTVSRGLHRAEGLDHELVDQALDFALSDDLLAQAEKRDKKK